MHASRHVCSHVRHSSLWIRSAIGRRAGVAVTFLRPEVWPIEFLWDDVGRAVVFLPSDVGIGSTRAFYSFIFIFYPYANNDG